MLTAENRIYVLEDKVKEISKDTEKQPSKQKSCATRKETQKTNPDDLPC